MHGVSTVCMYAHTESQELGLKHTPAQHFGWTAIKACSDPVSHALYSSSNAYQRGRIKQQWVQSLPRRTPGTKNRCLDIHQPQPQSTAIRISNIQAYLTYATLDFEDSLVGCCSQVDVAPIQAYILANPGPKLARSFGLLNLLFRSRRVTHLKGQDVCSTDAVNAGHMHLYLPSQSGQSVLTTPGMLCCIKWANPCDELIFESCSFSERGPIAYWTQLSVSSAAPQLVVVATLADVKRRLQILPPKIARTAL